MDIRVPVATYRLQLTPQFGFAAVRTQVPYLAALGITDLYLSPIFKSQKGSLSGYDIVDFTQLNPELGTEAEFDLLVLEAQKHGMAILLDIVPNHMAITSENPFWIDVLENGLYSPFASFFDIDWTPCDNHIENQVLLPMLGKPYGNALEDGEIRLVMDDSQIFVNCNSARLPFSLRSYVPILLFRIDSLEAKVGSEHPGLKGIRQLITEIEKLQTIGSSQYLTDKQSLKKKIHSILSFEEIEHFIRESLVLINGRKGDIQSFDILDNILNQQVYRLAFWRTGREELNYRRFFDINNLIGIKVESPGVLEATHSEVLRMIKEGKIGGLRIDHIDGLYDPEEYLNRLRRYTGNLYIIVEKILTGAEDLPLNWPVDGTTGYDFAREVNYLFVDCRGLAKIEDHYARIIGRKTHFSNLVYEKKKLVIEDLFSGEFYSLVCRLHRLSRTDRYARDLSKIDLAQALIEVTANLPVYRTYICSLEVSPRDRQYLEMAFQEVQHLDVRLEETALEYLRRMLLLEFPRNFSTEQKLKWLNWLMKWQQLTGPVTAKGLEDTALYNFNRLISLNVIGASLQPPELSVDKFHSFNIARLNQWPLTLNETSTHDSKRSEDVGAAIDVISEMPKDWTQHLFWWRKTNHKYKEVIDGQEIPDPNMEELIYQTLLGSFPLNSDKSTDFRERFKQYILKAAREAKAYTSWIRPDERYEIAMISFADAILKEHESNEFLNDFIPFRKQIAFFGALNSLSQVLLKITSPGVPDFYQGNEFWKLDLVDPDNRRPVDYQARRESLSILVQREKEDKTGLVHDLLKNWQDGRIKLFLTYKALNFRRESSDLFQKGKYLPLHIKGKKTENIVAFARHWENQWAIVAVPRFSRHLAEAWDFPLDRHVWGKDILVLPDEAPSDWTNIFTAEVINQKEEAHIDLAQVFNTFPLALLTSRDLRQGLEKT